MKHEIDLSKYPIRTDLIIESIGENLQEEGIIHQEEVFDDIKVDHIEIKEEYSTKYNKQKGIYKTIRFTDITDTTNRERVEDIFVSQLKDLLEKEGISKSSSCLIIGLGNSMSTPDALGPKVIDHILVTRHLYLLEGATIEKGYRNTSAVAPGVTGVTGIETSDIILGIKEKINPDFLIVVDALSSSSLERLNKTIQLTNTGISPGSGIGNYRREISKQTIGIPVIAIGIPTVVDAVTIVFDTFHYLLQKISYHKENINHHKDKFVPSCQLDYSKQKENLKSEEKKDLLGLLGTLEDDEMKNLLIEVLSPIGYNFMVTPKEVDFLIDKLALLIGKGINRSIHDAIKNNK